MLQQHDAFTFPLKYISSFTVTLPLGFTLYTFIPYMYNVHTSSVINLFLLCSVPERYKIKIITLTHTLAPKFGCNVRIVQLYYQQPINKLYIGAVKSLSFAWVKWKLLRYHIKFLVVENKNVFFRQEVVHKCKNCKRISVCGEAWMQQKKRTKHELKLWIKSDVV